MKFYLTMIVLNLAILFMEHSMGQHLNFDIVIKLLLNKKPEKEIITSKILTKNIVIISIQYAL